jgi:hypothetical protein
MVVVILLVCFYKDPSYHVNRVEIAEFRRMHIVGVEKKIPGDDLRTSLTWN